MLITFFSYCGIVLNHLALSNQIANGTCEKNVLSVNNEASAALEAVQIAEQWYFIISVTCSPPCESEVGCFFHVFLNYPPNLSSCHYFLYLKKETS